MRAMEAPAGTPASDASLKRGLVCASAVGDCAHVQLPPLFDLGELSESPESVASSVGFDTGQNSHLPKLDFVGIVNAEHLLTKVQHLHERPFGGAHGEGPRLIC